MQKEVILHIGMPKTGITSIQRTIFNAKSKETLKKRGILTLNGLFDPLITTEIEILKSVPPKRIQKRIETIFHNHPFCCKILLSNEAYSSLPKNKIFVLAKGLEDYQTSIIIYIRRQDFFFETKWKQWDLKKMCFEEAYNTYMQLDPLHLYYGYLENWKRAFGKENIIVKCYEKKQLENGLIQNFFDSISQSADGIKIIENQNPGFNRDVLEMLHFAKNTYRHQHDSRLYNMLSQNNIGIKKPFDKVSLLTPGQRQLILQKYQESNAKVAIEYFNRKDGILFYDQVRDDEYFDYQGIEIGTVSSIFLELQVKQYKELHSQHERLKMNGLKLSKLEERLNKIQKL